MDEQSVENDRFQSMSRKCAISITVTTGFLLVYLVLVTLPISPAIVFLLFLTTVISMLWMVYAILTDRTHPVSETFDDAFYQDEKKKG